jgi:hypothetical protein
VKNKPVFFILPFILLSLLLGIYAGWLRMGWNFPMTDAMAHHGMLMVGSFLGTLILIERIVGLKIKWLYIFPVLNVLSLPALYFKLDTLGLIFLLAGSAGLILVYAIIYKRYQERYILIMMAGGLLLAAGFILLLTGEKYASAVPYWIGFLLLTILGERIDLAKFLPRKKFKNSLLWMFIFIFLAGLFMQYHHAGHIFAGAGLLLIAFWLMKYDIVNKSMKSQGIHRYIGTVLFSGYIWLFISGLLMLINPDLVYAYDAVLHAFFLGFVFLMIFAHAPIIFPGVMGFSFTPYHKSLYTWMILLNLSLLMRIVADLFFLNEMRQISGIISGVIIIGFFINLLVIIRIKISTAGKVVKA